MKIHHVGIVVKNIDKVIPEYTGSLGFVQQTPVIYDPEQDCRLVMLGAGKNDAGVELIEPASANSPVARQAKLGGAYAHICYHVRQFDVELERLLARGAVLVKRPAPAALFDGRRVVFLFLRTRQLIELLEEKGTTE